MLSWLKRRKTRTCWRIAYQHKHGIDFSVFTTEKKAFRAAAEIILTWLGDLSDKDAQIEIAELIVDGNYREAWYVWSDCSEDHGEVMDIERVPYNLVLSNKVLQARARKTKGELCESVESG